VAIIHSTTLVPSKLELLTAWLPRQAWYRGTGTPVLSKAGGFRVDDPDGEVGIEILLVADADGTTYVAPMTYRGTPLDGADDALIGTSEHGVLGHRWIYDAERDPVAVAQLRALARGEAQAQHQSVSDTLDPTVTRGWSGPPDAAKLEVVRVLATADAADDGDDGAEEDDVAGWVAVASPVPNARVIVFRR
jgi:Maltokinase N-terminal cap domain